MLKTFLTPLILFSICAIAAAAQPIDTALAFFPLGVGDRWQYNVEIAEIGAKPYSSIQSIEVTGRRVMPNGQSYAVVNSVGALVYIYYLRVDTAARAVYAWSEGTGADVWYMGLDPGDSSHPCEYMGRWAQGSVFGEEMAVRPSGCRGDESRYALGIGKISAFYLDTSVLEPYVITTTLIYAKIGGREYRKRDADAGGSTPGTEIPRSLWLW